MLLLAGAAALSSLACAEEYDVPEHDAIVTSNCSGEVQSGRFHFDATNFSEDRCSGGYIGGGCSTSAAVPRKVSGDLEPVRFVFSGFPYGDWRRYELLLEYPEGSEPRADLNRPVILHEDSYILCEWPANPELELSFGAHTGCYSDAEPCWADLVIER